MTVAEAKTLKANIHATFESAHGKETMRYIEKIGCWTPTVYDSGETNEIIARDANRRLIGTLKSIMILTAEQIAALTEE
jgi:hypothetical protein